MESQDLQHLLDEACVSLIDAGRFPDGWVDRYRSALHLLERSSGESAWPKELFARFHFASTYLCLRYSVWKVRAATGNCETERMLGMVQLETDLRLWNQVGELQSWDFDPLLSADEKELISLCFGERSPVESVSDLNSFVDWKETFQERLDLVKELLSGRIAWNQWLCMALHFAGFYADLYQQRDMDLGDAATEGDSSDPIRTVVSKLGDRIRNRRVLNLIELWLRSAGVARTHSGIPDIGKPRRRTGQFVSVRTPCELFILEPMIRS